MLSLMLCTARVALISLSISFILTDPCTYSIASTSAIEFNPAQSRLHPQLRPHRSTIHAASTAHLVMRSPQRKLEEAMANLIVHIEELESDLNSRGGEEEEEQESRAPTSQGEDYDKVNDAGADADSLDIEFHSSDLRVKKLGKHTPTNPISKPVSKLPRLGGFAVGAIDSMVNTVKHAFGSTGCTTSDTCRNTTGLAQAYGYNVETHHVDALDCYVLTLFRITGRSAAPSPNRKAKPVIFLQHGVLDSSDTWLLNGPTQSLGFILSDAGFDVWLGNTRGNIYSRANNCLGPSAVSSSSFWNFSFDQMQEFDMPASINYVLKATGRQQLVYVGHSQGSTQAIANFCTGTSLASKIAAFIALAPVFHLTHSKSILLQELLHMDMGLLKILGVKEFLPSSATFKLLLPSICGMTSALCEGVIYVLTGFNKANFNESRMGVYMNHFPAGVSVREIQHFSQLMGSKDGLVRRFDEGEAQNLIKYKSKAPPVYDVTKINAPPTYFFYGGEDKMADVDDVQRLISEWPKTSLIQVKLEPKFGHLDFVWTEQLSVYTEVVRIAKLYPSLQKQIPS